jgi:hypothetical protein
MRQLWDTAVALDSRRSRWRGSPRTARAYSPVACRVVEVSPIDFSTVFRDFDALKYQIVDMTFEKKENITVSS